MKTCYVKNKAIQVILFAGASAVVVFQFLLVKLHDGHSNSTTVTDILSHSITVYDNSSRSSFMSWNSSSASIPKWMKDYIQWHTKTRQEFLSNPDIWKSHEDRPKLLILQCTSANVKCGGLADRIKPLPLVILGASLTKRLFFIRWKDRPAKLEEFLQPPIHQELYLDWRLPEWLDDELGNDYEGYSRRHIINIKPFVGMLERSSDKDIVTATMQWWDGGEQAYKDTLKLSKNDDEFQRIYHDLFRVCFEPTRPIQQKLQYIYTTTELGNDDGTPRDYVVAHYRALWWEDQNVPSEAEQAATARNAVDCASRLGSKGRPIYFATDSLKAQKIIQEYALQKKARPIVVIDHPRIVHLDRVRLLKDASSATFDNFTKSDEEDGNKTKVDVSMKTIDSLEAIYPVFVDLYLMANGNCLSFGDGGYGKLGLMLGKRYGCYFRHIKRHQIQKCEFES
jgi:hypothetical protein